MLAPVVLAACSRAADAPVQPTGYIEDPHSYARPTEAAVQHVHLDLRTDFKTKRLSGTATLSVQRAPRAEVIVLDVLDLDISSVRDDKGNPLQYIIGTGQQYLGTPLTINLPRAVDDRIVIEYATAPEAGALQWLEPGQTAGKQHPFLFTQGQAILTRTWVPTQDSPGIRQTYSARITVPSGLVAVMSAEQKTPQGVAAEEGWTAYEFSMPQAVPPYLMALAVGDLAFRSLGERSGVFAEASIVDQAANEFAETEKMISATEALYGPYRWGRHDILVLPPSFPFGGMENPRLTFATPTILAGDRSLVSLIAHELAHSWSGNLVTNATWEDFWLNEGVTTYIENRIMEALYGKEYADMLAQLGRQDLANTIADLGGPAHPDTRLHMDVTGRNPDDAMNDVAYEKGAAFLKTVEATVGRERFDAFLRSYFDEHAFQPMTAERFLAYLRQHLIKGDSALEARIQPEEWIYQPGLPNNIVPVSSDRFVKAEAQANAFASGTAAALLATENWSTHEWLHFLRSLPERLTAAQLQDLDRTFGFTQSGNSEIAFQWFRTAIRNRYEPALLAMERYLTNIGRRKLVLPLYRDLMATDWGKPVAARIYSNARRGYHAVTRESVDAVIGNAP
jgi:aminopeptidase N